MTRGEFKDEINNIFNYFGFSKSKENNIDIYKRNITIRTQGETMIINGQMMQQPGRVGDITLKTLVCDGVGEINECNEISTPMISIHMQAIFKEVTFKELHQLVEIGDVTSAKSTIESFLYIFGL